MDITEIVNKRLTEEPLEPFVLECVRRNKGDKKSSLNDAASYWMRLVQETRISPAAPEIRAIVAELLSLLHAAGVPTTGLSAWKAGPCEQGKVLDIMLDGKRVGLFFTSGTAANGSIYTASGGVSHMSTTKNGYSQFCFNIFGHGVCLGLHRIESALLLNTYIKVQPRKKTTILAEAHPDPVVQAVDKPTEIDVYEGQASACLKVVFKAAESSDVAPLLPLFRTIISKELGIEV